MLFEIREHHWGFRNDPRQKQPSIKPVGCRSTGIKQRFGPGSMDIVGNQPGLHVLNPFRSICVYGFQRRFESLKIKKM